LKLKAFLHVEDNAGHADDEHPIQGALPVLKLVTQPPVQLLKVLSSFASLVMTVVGALDDVSVFGDVWRGAALRATARCIGLLRLGILFGASTSTLGSALAAPAGDVTVCEIAAPPRLHVNSAMHEQETARLDQGFMTMSSQAQEPADPIRTRSIDKSAGRSPNLNLQSCQLRVSKINAPLPATASCENAGRRIASGSVCTAQSIVSCSSEFCLSLPRCRFPVHCVQKLRPRRPDLPTS
jgi:hypothetical protein